MNQPPSAEVRAYEEHERFLAAVDAYAGDLDDWPAVPDAPDVLDQLVRDAGLTVL